MGFCLCNLIIIVVALVYLKATLPSFRHHELKAVPFFGIPIFNFLVSIITSLLYVVTFCFVTMDAWFAWTAFALVVFVVAAGVPMGIYLFYVRLNFRGHFVDDSYYSETSKIFALANKPKEILQTAEELRAENARLREKLQPYEARAEAQKLIDENSRLHAQLKALQEQDGMLT